MYVQRMRIATVVLRKMVAGLCNGIRVNGQNPASFISNRMMALYLYMQWSWRITDVDMPEFGLGASMRSRSTLISSQMNTFRSDNARRFNNACLDQHGGTGSRLREAWTVPRDETQSKDSGMRKAS